MLEYTRMIYYNCYLMSDVFFLSKVRNVIYLSSAAYQQAFVFINFNINLFIYVLKSHKYVIFSELSIHHHLKINL